MGDLLKDFFGMFGVVLLVMGLGIGIALGLTVLTEAYGPVASTSTVLVIIASGIAARFAYSEAQRRGRIQ